MRHGLISWDATGLTTDDLGARWERLRNALDGAGLDALLIYTNFVRSAAVTWAAGFTPYWSDGLWLLPRRGTPLLTIGLSPRTSQWMDANSPGSELVTTPAQGTRIGERLAELGVRRLGVVEPDRIPAALADQIAATCGVETEDATGLYGHVRAASDAAERRLADATAALCETAFAAVPHNAATVGDATGAVELAARLAGAEEVYMASIPDLAQDTRFARIKGTTPLGARFALRASLARHGNWTRWIRTFNRDAPGTAEAETWFTGLAGRLVAAPGIGAAIVDAPPPAGHTLEHWRIEAPTATRTLQTVAETGADPAFSYAAATITVRLTGPDGPIILGGPLRGAPPE